MCGGNRKTAIHGLFTHLFMERGVRRRLSGGGGGVSESAACLFPRSGGTRARATRRRRRNVRTYKEKNFLRRVGIKSRYERNASVDTLIHFIPSHRFRRRREGDAARQRRGGRVE